MVNPVAKQVLRCRAPKKGRHRLEPSIAYPFRCPGCGYHFRSMANLRDHQEAFGDATVAGINGLLAQRKGRIDVSGPANRRSAVGVTQLRPCWTVEVFDEYEPVDELFDEYDEYEPLNEPCPGCGDPDCDFDCDGDYDPWT